ncbi:MAG: TetR/AcrR family transcriptional regulator [Candidatus Eisenbacteria bacterium]
MSSVRERILDVAGELFYREGVQAVGVDAIIAKADVARMSFYRHFRSKEGLVIACVERRDEHIRAWFETQVARLAPDARDRPLAVFDALARRISAERYRGCGFLNTMAEMADRTDAAHRAAAAHKARFQDYFARLLREAGLGEEHAADLMQLFDGAVVTAAREGTNAAALRAKRIAALLLGVPASAKPAPPAGSTNATVKARGKESSRARAKRVTSAKAAAASTRARARSVTR